MLLLSRVHRGSAERLKKNRQTHLSSDLRQSGLSRFDAAFLKMNDSRSALGVGLGLFLFCCVRMSRDDANC